MLEQWELHDQLLHLYAQKAVSPTLGEILMVSDELLNQKPASLNRCVFRT